MIRASLTILMLATWLASSVAAQNQLGESLPDARLKYPPPSDVRVTRNLEYARYGDRRMLLDLYLPPDGPAVRPVIVVVRGGGWHSGDKDGFGFIAGYLAAAGFAAVSIEYRPTEEARFPAAVHDVKAAVRWLRANAAQRGLDANRIGAIGGSAGGHLVALLGTSAGHPELEGPRGNAELSSRPAAVVAMAPLTDFRLTWSQPNGKDGVAFLGPGLTADDRRLLLASPVTHVTSTAAALLLIHSRIDSEVPYQQSLALKARYDAVGRPVELISFEAAPHDFWNYSSWFPEAMGHAIAFFRRTLR